MHPAYEVSGTEIHLTEQSVCLTNFVLNQGFLPSGIKYISLGVLVAFLFLQDTTAMVLRSHGPGPLFVWLCMKSGEREKKKRQNLEI